MGWSSSARSIRASACAAILVASTAAGIIGAAFLAWRDAAKHKDEIAV